MLAGAALVGLVLHFAVPYGWLDVHEGADTFGVDSQAVWRSDAVETTQLTDVASASPGLVLFGFLLALVAGVAAVGLGFVPLQLAAARWTGWLAGAAAAVGAFLVLVPSLMWTGSGPGYLLLVEQGQATVPVLAGGGLTGLIELVAGTDTQANLWVIGPLLSALLAGAVLWAALRLCANVVRTEHGFRERAQTHLRGAAWAAAFLAAVLVVPWSIVQSEDAKPEPDRDPFFQGAHAVLVTHASTAGFGGQWFDGLALAISVFVATAWVGLAAALFGSLGGVLASTGAPPEVSRVTHHAVFASLVMLVWSGVMYVLAWASLWRPEEGVDAQPGYVPILVAVPFALWVAAMLPLVRVALGIGPAEAAKRQRAVQFD